MKYNICYYKDNNISNCGSTFDKIAVIVEPRKHKNLIPVVMNFISILPDEWKIKIFYGKSAYNYIYNSDIKSYIDTGKIFLQQLLVDNLDRYTYSDLLKSKKFWEDCLVENILMFQTDSILCKNSEFNINDFLDFDYIGSAWWFNVKNQNDNCHGGNGGFSFRKRSSMIECINKFPPVKTTGNVNILEERYEDVYFINSLFNLNKKISSKEESKKFGVQNFYDKYKSFGTHRFWDFLSEEKKNLFLEKCPEGKIINP
tara:strand:- start:64 stop:834 length:771 start_codon:yes stop_codon:yes gene_type:complete